MPRAEWDRSINMHDRMGSNPLYEEPDEEAPSGIYAGRQIITRDTPINGGVYLGSHRREAIVVDDAKHLDVYNEIYTRFADTVYTIAANIPDASVQQKVLMPALAVAQTYLPYSEFMVSRLTAGSMDKKVNLATFIRHRAGVCRHQALLCGYLLERFQQDEELDPADRISIDRNKISGVGGHAWVRFISSDGTVYVVDPAQNVVAPLESIDSSAWDYWRPEEH
jgi:hypothetical protein